MSATSKPGNSSPSRFTSRWIARMHSRADEVAKNVQGYFASEWPWSTLEERDKFLTSDLEWCMLSILPDALDDRIELAVMLADLMFLIDDAMDYWSQDQAKAFFKQFQGLVLGLTDPAEKEHDPIQKLVKTLFTQVLSTDEGDPRRLGARFCQEICRWFIVASSKKDRSNALADLERYLQYRFVDAAIWSAHALMRWSCDINLASYMREDPDIILLEETAGRHSILNNDLFSYDREIAVAAQENVSEMSKNVMNAVSIVERQQKCSKDDAMNYLLEYIADLEEKFMVIEQEAKRKYSGEDLETVEKYSTALKSICTGNIAWSSFCGRYNQTEERGEY
ncbi:isoprenoid synthase domain-containing protein [Crucibulum laeve]|uniref:Terpene synthase n=1 Tax=Crucibulum laeve TaxID=68775 RepID=A0A5C3LFW1_9AGAR|nr:isoprenoid synthase domain-containing protein [Crucibulum laeve]